MKDLNPRTAYSLDADIDQIAKNCRTIVEMIEKYYASHIKTNLDAEAINRVRPRKKKKAPKDDSQGAELTENP